MLDELYKNIKAGFCESKNNCTGYIGSPSVWINFVCHCIFKKKH